MLGGHRTSQPSIHIESEPDSNPCHYRMEVIANLVSIILRQKLERLSYETMKLSKSLFTSIISHVNG